MEDHSHMTVTEQAIRTITQNADLREALLEPGVHSNVNGEVTLYINTNNDTVIVEDRRETVACESSTDTEDVMSSNDGVDQNKTKDKASSNALNNKNTTNFASILNLHQKSIVSDNSGQTETVKSLQRSGGGTDSSGKIPLVDALKQEIAMLERRNADHDMIVCALKMNISLFEKRMTDQEAIINVTKQKYETQVEALQDKLQALQEKVSELMVENETLRQLLTRNTSTPATSFKVAKTPVYNGTKGPTPSLKKNLFMSNVQKKNLIVPKKESMGSMAAAVGLELVSPSVNNPTEGQTSDNQKTSESAEQQGRGMRKKKKKSFGDDEDDNDDDNDDDDGIDDGVTYEVIEGGSQRGRKKLISSEGYTYNLKRENPDKSRTNWTCSFRTKHFRCPASVSQLNNKFRRGQFPHNHDAKPDATVSAKIRAELRSRVQETHCFVLPAMESPSVIVNDIVSKKTTPDMWENQARQMRNLKRSASRMKQKVEKAKQNVGVQLNLLENSVQEDGGDKTQLLYASEEQIAVLKAMFPENSSSSPEKKQKDT